MNDPIDTPIQDYTYIGEGTFVQGSLTFKGDTKIAGKVKGEVRVQGEVPFSVEPTGFIQGTIYCHHLHIYGEVNGDIHSQGTVTLYPSSKLEGQLEAAHLVIHPGAIVNFEGKTNASLPGYSSAPLS